MRIGIVGGGICGLYLAINLAKKGEEVFVFEKKKQIGQKACSCLISERIFDFLPQAKKLQKILIKKVIVVFPKKEVEIFFKRNFFVFERKNLEETLYFLAKKEGVKIFLGKKIEDLPKGFDVLIGADGALSVVRKKLNLKKEPEIFLGLQAMEKKENYDDFATVFPTKFGILWKIPRGENTEWGIVERPKFAKKIFFEFLKKNKIEIFNLKSSFISQGLVFSSSNSIFLLGEAQGLTKPWSFGGIIWGLESCKIFLKNFLDAQKFEKEVKKFFLPQIFLSKILRKIFCFLGFNFPYFLPKTFKIDGDYFLKP